MSGLTGFGASGVHRVAPVQVVVGEAIGCGVGRGAGATTTSAPDHPVTPTELARCRMMTSGGMTAAIDRLERRGLVSRLPNPADRRGSLVRLTEEGRDVIERAVDLQADVERRLCRSLTDRQVDQLAGPLRRLFSDVDPDGPGGT